MNACARAMCQVQSPASRRVCPQWRRGGGGPSGCTALPFVLAFLVTLWVRPLAAADAIARPDQQRVCETVAADIKQVLRVAGAENKAFRQQRVCVLTIENHSTAWVFGQNAEQETSGRTAFSEMLAMTLERAPERYPEDRMNAYAPGPEEKLHAALTSALGDPLKQWVSEEMRLADRVEWVLYGYVIDLPGSEASSPQPGLVLKMTELQGGSLVWGGCFSFDSARHYAAADVFPERQEIARAIALPEWAAPAGRVSWAFSYWPALPAAQRQDSRLALRVFADLLVAEFARTPGLRHPGVRLIDPEVLANAAETLRRGDTVVTAELAAALSQGAPWGNVRSLVTGYASFQGLHTVEVVLKRTVLTALDESRPTAVTPVTVSGFTSAAGGFAQRREWTQRALSRMPETLFREKRTLTLADDPPQNLGPHFRDVADIALAGLPITGVRVLTADAGGMADYGVILRADSSAPARVLYAHVVDNSLACLRWGIRVPQQGADDPSDVYQQYCRKAETALRTEAPDYGEKPTVVWHLTPTVPDAVQPLPWPWETVAVELVLSVTDPSRPFVHTLAGALYGDGTYDQLKQATKELAASAPGGIRAITLQLLPRRGNQRPVFLVSYLDLGKDTVESVFFDEPPGVDLPEVLENQALAEVTAAVQMLGETPPGAPGNLLIQRLAQDGLDLPEKRVWEMIVSRLALRHIRKPSARDDLLAAVANGHLGPEPRATLAKEGIGAVVVAEWLPGFETPAAPGAAARRAQLVISETDLSTSLYLGMGASDGTPGTSLPTRRNPLDALGPHLLRNGTQALLRGARDSREWRDLAELEGRDKAVAQALAHAVRDYAHNANLPPTVVLIIGDTTVLAQLDGGTVAPCRAAIAGMLQDTSLPATTGARETHVVAVTEVTLEASPSAKPTPASELRLTQAFPPDWYGTRRDGAPLLGITADTAVLTAKRNLELQLRAAGYQVLNVDDFAWAHSDSESEQSQGKAPPPISVDALAAYGESLRRTTLDVRLSLRDVRYTILPVGQGQVAAITSMTIEPRVRMLFPEKRSVGNSSVGFRLFLVQSLAEEDPALRADIVGELNASAEQDLEQAVAGLRQNGLAKARPQADQVLQQLARWRDAFPSLSAAVAKLALALADQVGTYQAQQLKQLRERAAGAADVSAPPYVEIRQAASEVLDCLKDWSQSHAAVGQALATTARSLADGVVTTQIGAVESWLAAVASGAAGSAAQEEAHKVCMAAAQLLRITVDDVRELAARAGGEVGPARERLIAATAKLAAETLRRANAHYKESVDEKTPEWRLAKLQSLHAEVEAALNTTDAAGQAFAEAASMAAGQRTRTPEWSRRKWRGGVFSSPKPAQTLMDATSALAEEVARQQR